MGSDRAIVFNPSQETPRPGPPSFLDVAGIIDEFIEDCASLVHIMYTCKTLYVSTRPTLYRRFFLSRGPSWVYQSLWPEGFCSLDTSMGVLDSEQVALVTRILGRASVVVPLTDLPAVRVITDVMPFMGLLDGLFCCTTCDYDGYLPFLCVAAAYGMNGILQLLLPFGPALEYENPRVSPAGLEWLVEPNDNGPETSERLSALFCAVANNNTLSAALLLQAGASPREDAFAAAIRSNEPLLLEIFAAYEYTLLQCPVISREPVSYLMPAEYALAIRQWWTDPEPLEVVHYLSTHQCLPESTSNPHTVLTMALERFYPATACMVAGKGSWQDLLLLCSGRFMGYRQRPDRPGALVWLEEDVVEHCLATLRRNGLMPRPLAEVHVGQPQGPLPPPSPCFPSRRAARLAQLVCRVLRVREPPVMADWQIRAPLVLEPGLCEASRGLHASAASLPGPYHDLLRHLSLSHAADAQFDAALILNTYWPSGSSAEGQYEGIPDPDTAGQLSFPSSPCGCFEAVANGHMPPSPRVHPPSRPSFAWSVSMTGCAAFHALHHRSAASASRWAFYVHRPILDWVFFTHKGDRNQRACLRLLPSHNAIVKESGQPNNRHGISVDFCAATDPVALASSQFRSRTQSPRSSSPLSSLQYHRRSSSPPPSLPSPDPGNGWADLQSRLRPLSFSCHAPDGDLARGVRHSIAWHDAQRVFSPFGNRKPIQLALPPCSLAGVVAVGHTWYLVPLEHRVGVPLPAQPEVFVLGSTAALEEIYKLMHSLQVVREWAESIVEDTLACRRPATI